MGKPNPQRHAAEALVFCLSLCRGWGRRRINRLLYRPDYEPARAWQVLREGDIRGLTRVFEAEAHALPPGDLPALAARAENLVAAARQRGLHILLPGDAAYPAAWRTLLGGDAPPFVLALGTLDLAGEPLRGGVAGTRQPTAAGRGIARRCGQALAGSGATVVSGGAAGVDTEAHDAALASGGRTVFVVPADFGNYRADWLAAARSGRALILSECLPGAAWSTHAAVQRNRLIAALSLAVWIVEPRRVGGSIRTARVAAALGRPVICYGPPPWPGEAAPPWDILDGPDAVTPQQVRALLSRPQERVQGELFAAPEP